MFNIQMGSPDTKDHTNKKAAQKAALYSGWELNPHSHCCESRYLIGTCLPVLIFCNKVFNIPAALFTLNFLFSCHCFSTCTEHFGVYHFPGNIWLSGRDAAAIMSL